MRRNRGLATTRLLVALARPAAAVLGLVAVAGLLQAVHTRALASERLALRAIEVRGAVRLDPDAIRAAAEVGLGTNLLRVDPGTVQGRVEALGWVRQARVERRFPDVLEVRVEEHEPVAIVALADLFYVDGGGRVFRAYQAPEPLDLPLVLGLDRGGYERAEPRTLDSLERAIAFLADWRRVFGADAPGPKTVTPLAGGLIEYQSPLGANVSIGPAPWTAALESAEAQLAALAALAAEGRAASRLHVGRGRRTGRLVVAERGEAR